jgi:hypothetical protein
MNLPGRLRLTTLGDVLGAMHREHASGILELVETEAPNAGRRHRIHFIGGLVEEIESELVIAERHELLETLFRLGDARLTFHVARAGKRRERPLGPPEFLHGRPRSRDKGGGRATKRRDPTRARALATLGLPDEADRTSVLRAFRTLAVRLHPDRFPSATPAERAELMRRFAEITQAYHVLVA